VFPGFAYDELDAMEEESLIWWLRQAEKILASSEIRTANAASAPYIIEADRQKYINRLQRSAGFEVKPGVKTRQEKEEQYAQTRARLKGLPGIG
jgi:hypothetical protein